jgi:hypothetical protein
VIEVEEFTLALEWPFTNVKVELKFYHRKA